MNAINVGEGTNYRRSLTRLPLEITAILEGDKSASHLFFLSNRYDNQRRLMAPGRSDQNVLNFRYYSHTYHPAKYIFIQQFRFN